MEKRFYLCQRCGNLVGMIHSSGVPIVCCGQPMTHLEPNTTQASAEKHLPVVQVQGDTLTVTVGSAAHPMTEAHRIAWVYVQLENGGMRKALNPGDEPSLTFTLGGQQAVAVYAYCNQHGLWMTRL